MAGLAWAVALLWLLNLALPWRPWSTRERIEPGALPASVREPVGVLIPARNEAGTIARMLAALRHQAGIARIVVVDDRSDDDTAAIAASIAAAGPAVRVVNGSETPASWSGKLWAQQQGLERLDTPLLLLLDADIELAPGLLDALHEKLLREQLDQISIMAELPAESLPERLMLPAFIYFFKQLYPFAWVNRHDRPFAAAAGGCVLLRREALLEAGGFAAWRDCLIDDCELAARVRARGGRIWLGLSHSVRSLRRHPDFESVLETVRRTAYIQLRQSTLLLGLVVVLMLLLFALPPLALAVGLLSGRTGLLAAGAIGWLLMTVAYLPQVRFSRLRPAWALTLPAAAMLFLRATIESALRHHFGRGADWKGRRYRNRSTERH